MKRLIVLAAILSPVAAFASPPTAPGKGCEYRFDAHGNIILHCI